jgi:hypothetical protein
LLDFNVVALIAQPDEKDAAEILDRVGMDRGTFDAVGMIDKRSFWIILCGISTLAFLVLYVFAISAIEITYSITRLSWKASALRVIKLICAVIEIPLVQSRQCNDSNGIGENAEKREYMGSFRFKASTRW